MSSEDNRLSSDKENSSDTNDPLDDIVVKHKKNEKKKQGDYEDGKENGDSSSEDAESKDPLDDHVIKDNG